MGSAFKDVAAKAKDLVEGVAGVSLDAKQKQLAESTIEPTSSDFTRTNWGVITTDTESSLKAGDRGPTLLQDFELREKVTHFDHERIPERVVHARGAGVHGYFELYESQSSLTSARILTDTSRRTPVFVRFSTVLGSRGSSDTVRDVRGFATRFYTPEGNWDLVGNNIPVFFIQDGIKFPDVIHAGKPEPDVEIPQAQSAHDNFWDFITLTPETTHMALWLLSDRAIPRSYRMMEGFGVNTFTLISSEGRRSFVKFHWRPVLGAHGLAWDEAQKLGGQDPDFHRRDLYDAIANGAYPEYELGIQVVPEADEHNFSFDILDATKLIPEELVPVRIIGKMTLNRAPDEFFPQVEQIAFCIQNVVPGIGFSDDPLLQSRNFSYLDTQLLRLGPNFMELPINRPVCPVMNHMRDGAMRMTVTKGRVNYAPNRFGILPSADTRTPDAYAHHPTPVSGIETRRRGPKFSEHYAQARLFYNSLSAAEKTHVAAAASFEAGKCRDEDVRRRVVNMLFNVDRELGTNVASALGVDASALTVVEGPPTPAAKVPLPQSSPALSMDPAVNKGYKPTAKSRQVAIVLAAGYDAGHVRALKAAVELAGGIPFIVAPTFGATAAADGTEEVADFALFAARSTQFDALAVAGGSAAVKTLLALGQVRAWLAEVYKHGKPMCVIGEAVGLLEGVCVKGGAGVGVVAIGGGGEKGTVEEGIGAFVEAMKKHRFWERDITGVPAS